MPQNQTEPFNGYHALLSMLRDIGVEFCAGVTGGGIIHFLKYLPPFGTPEAEQSGDTPSFYSIQEYVAGFIPLGVYLASGRPGCCIATTGAASKLLACGLSDAKMHDIPSVYLLPVSPKVTEGLCPLQDTSEAGSNVLGQLRAELPDGVFLLDSPARIVDQLQRARDRLSQQQPVVLLLEHKALNTPLAHEEQHPAPPEQLDMEYVRAFNDDFVKTCAGRRVVILAGEELARFAAAKKLTSRVCAALQAPVVWSINGVNGIASDNPYAYGCIGFGGNDIAMDVWHDIGGDDVLLVLGACPDEYTVSLGQFTAGHTFVLSGLKNGYGQRNGSFQHRAKHAYRQLIAPLEKTLQALCETLERDRPETRAAPEAPASLDDRTVEPPRAGCVDMYAFHQRLEASWRPGTLGFDDVCLAYKDRQYVTQRPSRNAAFFSLYRGSAMGHALGVAIGARIAEPERDVVCITGDGCFRLLVGGLPDAAALGLLVFVLDNGTYAIVDQGLPIIIPDLPKDHDHTRLAPIDFVAVAKACNWEGFELAEDLSNLDEILEFQRGHPRKSVLVRVAVDADQILGENPRAKNL